MLKQHPLEFFKREQLAARDQQTQILDQIAASWDKYNYFALSLPTGVGKTYIATAIADSVKGSAYILTSTLQLQTQYEHAWDAIVNLKGRSNYQCNLNHNFTVDAAPCSANKELVGFCKMRSICAYYNQKNKALQARAMITNPVYMLYSTHCGFAQDEDSPWVKRDVLIIDEAHNIENHLVTFAESDVDPEYYYLEFGVPTNKIQFTGVPEDDYLKVVEIQDILKMKALELQLKLEREFPAASMLGMDPREWARGITKKAAERVERLNAKIYRLDKAIQPLKIFFNTHSTPDELSSRWLVSKVPDKNVLKLAPIYGDFLFKEYFGTLADKFVFLSATLGSKYAFCKEIGVNEKDCLFLETGSPFDPAQSPVIIMPVISLARDVKDENMHKLGPIIDDILKLHPGQRGIIHSVTYDIGTKLFQLVSPENQRRLLFRDMVELRLDLFARAGKNPGRVKLTNEELLRKHEIEGEKYGSVLVSPSMMEGVDLVDDLSRFQVIVKLPWPYLGDLRVRAKSKLDDEWYANKMWVAVMQAAGRSTRHVNDSSVTYILDKKFEHFYRLWERKLPDWFKSRLVF